MGIPSFSITHPSQDVCSVVLHAPSEGLCNQYLKLVKSGLSVIASAIISSSSPIRPFPSPCSTSAHKDDKESPPLISVVPGGATFDVAMASRLDNDLSVIRGQVSQLSFHVSDHHGQSRHELLSKLLLRNPPSALLPALLVLRAMSATVPLALARSGISAWGTGGSESVDGDGPAGQRRAAMLTVSVSSFM